MRLVALVRAAVEAEIRREKLIATRGVRRLALAAAGGVMLLLVGVLLQVAIILALHAWAAIAPLWSVVIVAGADLAIGLVLLLMARGNAPRPLEIQARIERDQAVSELRRAAALAAIGGPALRLGAAGLRGTGRFVFRRNRRRR